MKLHLPKRLFTALLTAITLAAAPAALTLGSAAWGYSADAAVTSDADLLYSYSNGEAGGSSAATGMLTAGADGAGVANSDDTRPRATGLTACNETAPGFTLSVDVIDFNAGNWRNLLTLYTNGATSEDNGSLQLQKNASNELMLYGKALGGSSSGELNINLGSVDSWKGQTLTLSFAATNTAGEYILTVYKNGENVGSLTYTGVTAPGLTGYTFGTTSNNSRNSNYAIYDNVAIWSKSMTAAEVKELVVSPYVTTLDSGETAASSGSWSKDGASSTWDTVSNDSSAYLQLAGNAGGSTLNVGSSLTVRRIDATANNVTVKASGTVTVDELWASQGASLSMDSSIGSTAPLTVGGPGSITLLKGGSVNGLAVYTTLNLGNDATLSLNGNGSLMGAGKLSGGTLEIGSGSVLTVNVGNLADKAINSNISIKDGGRMEFTGGSAADKFNYDNSLVVSLEGTAELALGSTRQTVGNWTFDMTGGTISGQASIGLDFHSSGSIIAHAAETGATAENPTVSTVSASIKSRDNGELTLDVEENARLDLTGALQLNRKTIKDGEGLAVISGTINTLGELEVKDGTLELQSSVNTGSAITVDSGAEFEISAGTDTFSGAVTNDGAITVSGGSATLSGAVTNNGAITVSGGSATLSGAAVTNNGAITVSDGIANITNTLSMGTGSSLSVSGGSATVSGALNVTGTGVQIGQSGEGVLNLLGQVSIAENTAATLSGAITLGHTITNDGSLTLDGTIYLTGDIDTTYTHRAQGASTYALADGSDSTVDQNGFMTATGASYWLTQSTEGATKVSNSIGEKFAKNTNGEYVVYHDDVGYVVSKDEDSGQLFFSTVVMTSTQYYITTGDVVVNKAVQKAATGYTLQGGNMLLTEGSVNTGTITYDDSKYLTESGIKTGVITVASGAELLLDGAPAGATVNRLLSSILSSTSTGNIKITQSGLDTYDGAAYSLNSAFAGTLELAAEVDFTLGNGNENSYSDSAVITLGNLSGMKLNDGSTLYYNANGVTTIKNLQVVDAASATIHFKDSKSANAVQFAEKTQLDGDLTVSTTFDGGITFTNLVGDGSLSGSSGDGPFNTTISSLQYKEGDATSTFTGSLSFSGGSNVVEVSTGMGAAITFDALSATDVNSFTFNAQANTTTIGTLSAAAGAVNVSAGKTLELGAGTVHSIGTLSAAGASVTIGEASTLTLGAGTAEAAKQHSIGTLSAASAGVTLGEYATLTLGGGTADTPVTHSIGTLTGNTGSKLHLAENAVLNKVSSITSVTLTGSGTYNYDEYEVTNSDFSPGFTLDEENWTGTVALTDGNRGMALNKLKNASTANSKLKLTGFKGYLDGTNHTMSNNLILDNGTAGYGLLLDNGGWNESPTVYFTGSIEGTGDIVYSWKNTNGTAIATHVFSDITSGWEGKFVRDLTNGGGNGNGKEVVAKFTAGGNIFADTDTSGVMDAQKSGLLKVVIDATADGNGVKPKTDFYGSIIDVADVTVQSETKFWKDVTTSDFHANADTTFAGALTAASGTVTLGDSVTLTLGGGTAEAQKQHSIRTLTGGTGSMLNLAQHSVLNKVSTVNGTVALSGSGTYNLGPISTQWTVSDAASILGLTLADDWTGVVKVSGNMATTGVNDVNGAKLDDLANENSWVELDSVEGWIYGGDGYGASYDHAANLILSGTGLTINGSSQRTYTFSKSVKGTGDFTLATASGSPLTYVFSGNISEWAGAFVVNANDNSATPDTTLELTGGGNLFSGAEASGVVMNRGGVLNVNIGNANTDTTMRGSIGFGKDIQTGTLNLNVQGNTEFQKKVDVSQMTVSSGKTATLNAATTVGAMNAASGTVTLGDSVTLTLGGGTDAKNQVTHSIRTLTGGSGSYVNLAQHSVLDTITTASGVTLTGSGTYKLASGTMTMTTGVTLGAGWTGAVRLSGDISNLDLAGSLYKEASWVEFAGVTGYLKQGSNTYGANIRLTDNGENAAITLNNGWSGNTHTFSGKIEGEGTWKRINSGGTVQYYVFAGDVAGWTGAFVNAIPAKHGEVDTATYLTFRGASAINVDISNPGAAAGNVGALNVTINDAAQTGEKSAVAVNGSIQATKLTVDTSVSADFSNTVDVDTLVVNAGKTATFNNTATAGAVTNSGQIQLGKIVTNGEEKEMQVVATVSGGTMTKVQMSSEGISGTAQDGSMSNADIEVLAQDATFTIADMTLTNTSITAASVNIVNSKVSGNVVLNVVKPTADITAPIVGTGGSDEISFTYGLALVDSSSTLTLNMEVPQAILPSESGLYNLTITLNGFAEDFDFSDIANQVVFGADSWLGQALTGASTSVTVDGKAISAGAAAAQSSGAPSVSYNATSNVGSLVITITGLNVPEPTTATLSLLALAALVARRRRK